jgi:hypothetical protein
MSVEAKTKFEELLRKLVLLDLESEEAENIRDESDLYWELMTEQERDEIRKLAHDLTVQSDCISSPVYNEEFNKTYFDEGEDGDCDDVFIQGDLTDRENRLI